MKEYFVLAAFTQTNGKPIRLAAISMLLSVKGQLKSPRCSVTFKSLALLVSSKITLALYSICRDLSYNQISELSRNIFADLKGLEHL